ncbi:MAG: ribonuclease E/G [Phormidesmis priestleyi]|uniref:Ribonuclease E/G n=1 Tax=Phormidesmis priestleyi TaxID=268141 RepID=A0A2W4XS14_9CYAN|nr:MAG: ribonuclease E/G [Phormidesmis priestleyi]
MPKQIIIAEQHRIAAVFSEDQIQEIIVATGSHQVGDIYLGTVENILPGIDAAFVNIGDSDKNGFMHVSDLGPLKLKRMASSITELLAPRQKVLVQIMKEPTGNKGPRLTGKVTLPGRYLVLMPYSKGVNLSRRIRNETERNRLRALGILIKPPGMGLLIRTEAEGISEDGICEDLKALQQRWETIQEEALSTRPPSLLNRDDDFIQRVLRDVYSDDVNRIVADTDSGLERTKKHLTSWSDGRIPSGILIDRHRESTSVLEYFRVNAAIREALKPRVDLPSGGYIIIEPTEALTVIDVNSGSFTRSATARETVLWTNCEAAIEIARQLKLRNLAGVIIVDFIDMDARRDQMQVLEQFGTSLRADKSRPQISQLSELGLVELTRKRQGQNIYELFGQTCPTCGGLGHLAHLPGDSPEQASPVMISSARPQSYSSPAQSFSNRPSARDSEKDSGRDSGRHPNREATADQEERSFGLNSPADIQDLDLLNHPNYQDKNGRSSSRRRRRRGTESVPPRESRSGPPADPIPAAKDADERSMNPRRNGADSAADTHLDIAAENLLESKSEHTEPAPSRGKRSRNGRRKVEDPPEIVAVEMPLEEQRVYAMMGISPLVYTEQTVDNPQNVLISVVLPGEAEQFLAAAKAASEAAISNKRVITTPEPAESEPEEEAELLSVDEENSIEESSIGEASHHQPVAKAAPVKRRRRSTQQPNQDAAEPVETAQASESEVTGAIAQAPILSANAASNGGTYSDFEQANGTQEVAESPSAETEPPEAERLETESSEEKKVVRRRRRRSSASE